MNDGHLMEGTSESDDRYFLERVIVTADGNTTHKGLQKNAIRKNQRSSFRGLMKNRNQISHLRNTNNKTWFQPCCLSPKKFLISGRMMDGKHFNGTTDQFVWSNMSKSHFDDNESGTGVSSKSKKSNEINEDWGKRTELNNLFNVNDGGKVWNIIRRGLFANIKLWKNEYGSLCCRATGKISVKGISDSSIIEINTENNLRKMLNLSHVQWSALCEALDGKNIALAFNAYEDVDINKKSSLEKLWLFICKRRHFLPNICILGKLSGAVRLMKELLIMPKIVVTDIRDFKGEEIS